MPGHVNSLKGRQRRVVRAAACISIQFVDADISYYSADVVCRQRVRTIILGDREVHVDLPAFDNQVITYRFALLDLRFCRFAGLFDVDEFLVSANCPTQCLSLEMLLEYGR